MGVAVGAGVGLVVPPVGLGEGVGVVDEILKVAVTVCPPMVKLTLPPMTAGGVGRVPCTVTGLPFWRVTARNGVRVPFN